MTARPRAGAGPPVRRMGTWATWGRARRALVALRVGVWLVLGALAVIAIGQQDPRILLPAVALLGLDWWASGRLHRAEHADGALVGIDDEQLTADERELIDELDSSGGDRAADLVIAGRWMSGDPVLRRYEYPTRELLLLRSASEAIEVLGLAIVVLTAPAIAGVAIGFALVLLGGRAGTSIGRSALGDRLYRTPVDDRTRARWASREQRAIVVVAVAVLAVGALRWLG